MQNLESYGIFDKCHIDLQRASASSSSSSLPSSPPSPNVCDVTVSVKEKVWYGLKTEVYQEIHTQQTSIRFQGVLRNLFGRAERIEAATDGSLPFFRTFSLSLTRPRFLSTRLRSHVGIHSNLLNLTRTSSYHEHSRALTFSLSDPSGQHELGYEAALRELYPSARDLPADEKGPGAYQAPSESVVRASIVPSTKSSLKYTFTHDRLDSRLVPTQGTFLQAKGEVAGAGGDVRFVKGQLDVKAFHRVHPLVTLGVSLMGGGLQPLASSATTQLSDRFFFGTPLTLRGFETWSLGPIDHHDSMGGEVTVGAGLSASVPLPKSWGGGEGEGPRVQWFLNGGGLVGKGKAGWGGVGRDLWGSARWSTGVGLVIPTPVGRLEFNLVRPLVKMDTDRTKTVQFGIGLQFL